MGDANNVKEIAEKYHQSLFRYSMALSGRQRAEAEEIVQQLYLEMLEGKVDVISAQNKRAYLFGVARKIASSRRRRRSVWSRIVGLRPNLPSSGGESSSPEKLTGESENRAKLERALEMLPRRQLEVISLVFSEGLTVEEAASAMGISVGSARTHYHRAKSRLAKMLEEDVENEKGSHRKTA